MAVRRAMIGAGTALLLAVAADAGMLLRAALDQRPDALPPAASVIVLEAWANDAVTRKAFQLAQRYTEAQLLSVGALPARADALVGEGVCFPGTSFAAKTRAQLLSWGLPEHRVVRLEQSRRGTYVEALRVRAWLRERGSQQGGAVIVVTDWFHRQRSRLTYQSAMPGTDVRVTGGPRRLDASTWPDRDRRAALFSEFLKLAYYQAKGLISLRVLIQAQFEGARAMRF